MIPGLFPNQFRSSSIPDDDKRYRALCEWVKEFRRYRKACVGCVGGNLLILYKNFVIIPVSDVITGWDILGTISEVWFSTFFPTSSADCTVHSSHVVPHSHVCLCLLCPEQLGAGGRPQNGLDVCHGGQNGVSLQLLDSLVIRPWLGATLWTASYDLDSKLEDPQIRMTQGESIMIERMTILSAFWHVYTKVYYYFATWVLEQQINFRRRCARSAQYTDKKEMVTDPVTECKKILTIPAARLII